LAILEATQLWKKYILGEHPVNALAGVNLTVERGDFVAIMGPSGSGKSTLLHLLGGLDRPSDGEITLAGMRLSILNDDQATLVRRRNVGFIFQAYNLLPTMTAEENITLPLVIDGQDPARFRERVDALVNLVDLTDRRRHKPDQLSGGQQQRVAIARALVTQPAIVLADEPTGNLDSKTGTAIMDLLRRSRDELQQTIIMVTHDPRAAAYADRVVFLRDGQIHQDITFNAQQDMEQRLRVVIHTMEEPQN
jgi:putative ABC transport system ATP-binding protein